MVVAHHLLYCCLCLLLLLHNATCAPLFKVFCSGTPLFRGRVDSIVQPGLVSGHVHKVAGGSNFGPALASNTPLQVYNDMIASPCTTCSIGTVDLSAYWHPDLYYKWPNGSLSLVPKGGLTVYYLARAGSGDQANPAWKAFPPGFRMTSGNPFKRTYNDSRVQDQAVSFVCLDYNNGGSETPGFPTATKYCPDGLRMQVHFPQCWNGNDTDSTNHQSHVVFPIGTRPDGGNCPPTHPVRLPNLFFEAFYSVSSFPHGPAPYGDGTQRFVLACGDDTGYGFHGDFLNGWNQSVLQSALNDPSCDSTNTNDGNKVANCKPLAPFLQDLPDGACSLNRKIPLTENMAESSVMSKLPGCNPITSFGANPIPCSAAPNATEQAPASVRFHLQSVLTGKYATCLPLSTDPFKANYAGPLTYSEVFTARPMPGNLWAIQNEGVSLNYLSASGTNSTLMCNRGSASGWESFSFVSQGNNMVAIIASRNGKYITAYPDGTMRFDSVTVATAQLFKQIVPTGGGVY